MMLIGVINIVIGTLLTGIIHIMIFLIRMMLIWVIHIMIWVIRMMLIAVINIMIWVVRMMLIWVICLLHFTLTEGFIVYFRILVHIYTCVFNPLLWIRDKS